VVFYLPVPPQLGIEKVRLLDLRQENVGVRAKVFIQCRRAALGGAHDEKIWFGGQARTPILGKFVFGSARGLGVTPTPRARF
jgi:hypothetical protein